LQLDRNESSKQEEDLNNNRSNNDSNNVLLIDEILAYWFAKYDSIPALQNQLWMIPSGNDYFSSRKIGADHRVGPIYETFASIGHYDC
jgi:hypothetical protein